jgi:hypothetical protein
MSRIISEAFLKSWTILIGEWYDLGLILFGAFDYLSPDAELTLN